MMKNLLLNPFERVAGLPALLMGLAVIVVTASIASFENIRLDGVLDLHIQSSLNSSSNSSTFLNCFGEGIINWLSLAVFLYLAGLIFSKSKIRIVDVFGTQALARFPYVFAVLVTGFLFSDKMILYIEHTLLKKGEPVVIDALGIAQFIVTNIIMIATLIWMILLMYKAYSVSCNLKGTKSVVSFIVALLLAEVCSKILNHYLIV